MKPEIIQADETAEYFFREGCHILEVFNRAEDPALSIARARLAPGRRTRAHALDGITERYLIAAGEGRMHVGELPPTRVTAGDVVVIPPGVSQFIVNTGDRDLVFHALCTPRFTADCYRDLDEVLPGG